MKIKNMQFNAHKEYQSKPFMQLFYYISLHNSISSCSMITQLLSIQGSFSIYESLPLDQLHLPISNLNHSNNHGINKTYVI